MNAKRGTGYKAHRNTRNRGIPPSSDVPDQVRANYRPYLAYSEWHGICVFPQNG